MPITSIGQYIYIAYISYATRNLPLPISQFYLYLPYRKNLMVDSAQVASLGSAPQGNISARSVEHLQPQAYSEDRCRDLPCLVAFLFLFTCLWTLSGWSYYSGDPPRLQRGWDIYGNTCNYGLRENLGYTYFPIPLETMDVSLCLAGCPATDSIESLCPYNSIGTEIEDFECYNTYTSKPFFNKYCLPSEYHKRRAVLDWLYSADQVMTRVVGDLARVSST
jgi:hypothetical protein